MTRTHLVAALGAIALMGGTASSALAVPISSSINLNARASTANQPPYVMDGEFVSQGTTLGPLSASVEAISTATFPDGSSNGSTRAAGAASVVFADAGHGTLTYSNLTLESHGSHGHLYDFRDANGANSAFRYTFSADLSGNVQIDYDLTGDYNDGPVGGTLHPHLALGQLGLFIVTVESSPPFPILLGPTSDGTNHIPTPFEVSGNLSFAVVAGNTYSVVIEAAANESSGAFRDIELHTTGVFHFSIPTAPTIPEPATLGLLGLGAAGLASRRRRSARA